MQAQMEHLARGNRKVAEPLAPLVSRPSPFGGLRLGLLAVAALSVVAYASTPSNFWVADDYNYLFPKGLDRILAFFDPTVPTRAFYRPLNWTSWAIDYDLWGRIPFGWHVTSILMNLVASICVLLIVALLMRNKTLAVIAGALFAVHPAHPETVTWIGGRADLVAGLFYFPGVLFFSLFLYRRREGRTRPILYALSALMLIGAIMGKEMGVTLPLIFLLTDAVFFTPQGKLRSIAYWRGRILLHLPFFFIVLAYGLMRYLLVATGVVTNTYAGPSLLSVPGIIDAAATNVLLGIGIYNGNDLAHELPSIVRLIVVLAAVALVVFLVRWLGRPALYAALWILVTVAPTYNLAALRWLYIPSFGVCLLAALVFVRLIERVRAPNRRWSLGAVLAGVLVLAWGGAVVAENVEWHRSGEEARSVLRQIGELAPHPALPATIYFAGAPARLGTALLFNTGLPSAMSFVYPAGGVELHELEQPLPDPVVVAALQQPPQLRPNPLFMGYRQGTVVRYNSIEELVAGGMGK